MKTVLLLTSAFLTAGVVAHPDHDTKVDTSQTQVKDGMIIGHGSARYRVNTHWSKADPKVAPVTNAHAMIEDEKGQIYLITDQMEHAFLVYEKDGTFVRAFGDHKFLKGGHGIDVINIDGVEQLIHVDAGWHQTASSQWKFKGGDGGVTIVSKTGEIIKRLPTPLELGIDKEKKPYKPCDVAITKEGEILIVDGYASNRVIHLKADGTLVRVWGGSVKGAANLSNAHGISIDYGNPKQPVVWVSSRNENKLKGFTLEGKYIETLDLPGAYAGQALFKGDKIYTGVCWSKKNGVGGKLNNSGFVLVLDRATKKVISAPGGVEPVYIKDKLQPMHQGEKVFKHVHDLYVDSEGDIYVGEWNSGNRYPYKLELIKDK